jgi:hypothetical protein
MGTDRRADRLKRSVVQDAGTPGRDAILALLGSARLGTRFKLTPISGGANNRVWRVECGRQVAVLKRYFRHPMDRRDRLLAEFSFLTVVWEGGVRTVPRPLATLTSDSLALYELVEGRRPAASDVTDDTVGQFLDFYSALGAHKGTAPARWLPLAAEACARLGDHVACVDRRIQRLAAGNEATSIDRDAAGFVRTELARVWADVQHLLADRLRQHALTLDTEAARGDWGLSPSDFGFHNALLGADGRMRFLDFEYAGWDDPARMVCDFFCQPRVPVPMHHLETFVERVGATVRDVGAYRQRVEILLPIYRVKWCCILLNEFLPAGGDRRRFAGQLGDPYQRKVEQLKKARRASAEVMG